MREKYSLEYLLQVFSQLEGKDMKYRGHSKLVRNIKKLTKDKSISHIYPKNMFLDIEDFEIYIFTDDYIYITKVDEENGDYISSVIIRLKDIKQFKILDKINENEYDPIGFEMHFYDNKVISFNSELDTNEYHKHNFKILIKALIEFLT